MAQARNLWYGPRTWLLRGMYPTRVIVFVKRRKIRLEFFFANSLRFETSFHFKTRDISEFLNITKHSVWPLFSHDFKLSNNNIKGAFVWDQSGIRIIGIMRVSVCLGAILIPEFLDFHSGYSTPRSRIAGIYSRIYSGINSYSGISQTNAP